MYFTIYNTMIHCTLFLPETSYNMVLINILRYNSNKYIWRIFIWSVYCEGILWSLTHCYEIVNKTKSVDKRMPNRHDNVWNEMYMLKLNTENMIQKHHVW